MAGGNLCLPLGGAGYLEQGAGIFKDLTCKQICWEPIGGGALTAVAPTLINGLRLLPALAITSGRLIFVGRRATG
jgi:hypothetical protein